MTLCSKLKIPTSNTLTCPNRFSNILVAGHVLSCQCTKPIINCIPGAVSHDRLQSNSGCIVSLKKVVKYFKPILSCY